MNQNHTAMAHKYRIGDKVGTPYGSGIIDTLPYNQQSTVYIVLLDKAALIPISKDCSILDRTLVIDEKHIN